MGGRGAVDDVLWGVMKFMREKGSTIEEIAAELNVSKSTVHRHLLTALAPSRRVKKPKQMSSAQKKKIAQRRGVVVQLAKKKKIIQGWRGKSGRAQPIVIRRRLFPSVRQIAREVRARGVKVSNTTVRNDLLAKGLNAKLKPRGPRRRAGDKAHRLKFARRWLREKKETLHGIIFSDEKLCDTNDHGSRYEWCAKNERATHMERDRFAPKVHVWGAVGVGVKILVFLPEGGIDNDAYIKKCLSPHAATLSAPGRIFQQDGARCHMHEKTRAYQIRKGFSLLDDWPPRSPDLSPIESIWARCQRSVSENGPSNAEDLRKFWQAEWNRIPQSEIDACVMSFSRRLRAACAAGGDTITSH